MTVAERLQEIEDQAVAARIEAAKRLADLGTPDVDRENARYLAGMLGGGPIDYVPNLLHDGQRLAGQLMFDGRVPVIRVEAFDPPTRQVFSIAHELGHLELHASGVRDWACEQAAVGESEPDRTETLSNEREADAYAASFLVPTEKLRADLERYGRCAPFLACLHGVSLSMISRRIVSVSATA